VTSQQRKVMRAIETCRTAVLGGHLDVCPACDFQRPAYNSCRDRHCPKCQSSEQLHWVQERLARILPTRHFHVVFTVPEQLKPLALANKEWFFSTLFQTASRTLLELGEDSKRLGGQLGITAVLHTWTRDLRFHPHLHCLVTDGALNRADVRWRATSGRYLFPAKVLSRLFRGKLLAALEQARDKGLLVFPPLADQKAFNRFKDALYKKEWVVYAKKPFGGPAQVFRYLGRYTHRVALSNHRLLAMDETGVTFATRGDATATLAPTAFLSRFLLHVLPPGFTKIRHYGLYAAGNVNTRLVTARKLLETKRRLHKVIPLATALFVALYHPVSEGLDWRERLRLFGGTLLRCPRCGTTLVAHPLPSPVPRDSS
jgi:hypothetical protein